MSNAAAQLSAYKVTATPVRSERSIEYQAFADVTRAMSEAQKGGAGDFPRLANAVHANRRLWNLLAKDVASDDNKLPVEFRAQIFSLSIFVGNHASKVLDGNASLDTLIEINRSIMVGLRA